MTKIPDFIAGALVLLFLPPGTATAASTTNGERALADAGFEATRTVGYDLCLPADAGEYEALGKNAVLRIEAASVLSTELPLRRAYLVVKDLRIPLRRVVELNAVEDASAEGIRHTRYWRQVSFYVVPISLLKGNPRIVVDFTGNRTGFGVGTTDISSGPAFVRLDEYDTPAEPDKQRLTELLVREYPSDFPSD